MISAVEDSDMDFLMDDWSDIILEEFHNVAGFCPNCKNIIFVTAQHEYIYERGRILWSCENCDTEVFV